MSRLLPQEILAAPFGELAEGIHHKSASRQHSYTAHCRALALGWDLYIDKGATPLVRMIRMDTSDVPAKMDNVKMKAEIRFKNWNLSPEIPEGRFRIPPSDNAE